MPTRISYVALDWLLTGRTVGAREALSHGAISRISEGRPGKRRCASPNRSPQRSCRQPNGEGHRAPGLARQEAPSFAFQQGPVERLRQAAARR
ncbi:hypothetical protein M5585_20795 [Serratia ureilytica]